jgi:hypothetical protein
LLANPDHPGQSIAALVDARGAILVRLFAPADSRSVRAALESVEPGEPGGPAIDPVGVSRR